MMPRRAEYALRALVCLRDAEGPQRSIDLASQTKVPGAFLPKVLRRLVAAGLLTSQKGHGGGFALARPPEAIRLSEVLAAVEAFPTDEHCAFGWPRCDATAPCPLHDAWRDLQARTEAWAENLTLADLSAR